MSGSLGRLALGLVGAAIGAPFGLAAVGFSIGSAIGGFLFAPEGPNVEGPRLGDTDVQASTLGKIIPEHYGVTRASGNVFWSGGLKEIKTEEEQGGGKGGGGGGSVTTYSYFASFASAFGKGRAENVLRMWADGKLIYDVTGDGATNNGKYNFRLRKGLADTGTGTGTIDPLIAESINRRLAGLPDVNEGNQPQATYRTMNDLITEVSAETDARSQIYASYLTQLRDIAEGVIIGAASMVNGQTYTITTVGNTNFILYGAAANVIGEQFVATGPGVGTGQVREGGTGTPPDYQFTPSYKEVAYVVYDDFPLEDFGNRIPNITAEIVWQTDSVIAPNDTVTEGVVTEISGSTGTPLDGMGIDQNSRAGLFISNTTQLRRFSLTRATETFDRSTNYGNGINVERVLCADASGDWLVRGSTAGVGDKIYKLDNASMTLKSVDQSEMSLTAKSAQYASKVGINGSSSYAIACDSSGNLTILDTSGSQVKDVSQTLAQGLGAGPMVYGGGTPGDTHVYWASTDGTNVRVHDIGLQFPATVTALSDSFLDILFVNPSIDIEITDFDTKGLAGGYLSGIIYNFPTNRLFVITANAGGGGTCYQYDPDAEGTADDPYLISTVTFTGTPPSADSGFSRSGLTGATTVAFANGDDAYVVDLTTGEETVFTNVLSGTATSEVQIYEPSTGTLLTWIDGAPATVQFLRLGANLYSNDLASVVDDICRRVGMLDDEYDSSGIAGLYNVRGFTIARPTNGRKVLEKLFQAYFVDGVETDWKLKFKPQDSTAVRIINEDELGRTKSPTGDVPFLESRVPEQDLPAEVALIFSDLDRDYQQGAAHYRRVSQPTPSMYSRKTENIEFPFVLNEREARAIAERTLFISWMARDQGKTKFPWTHIDLDPADVVQFKFNDGRILTDRLTEMAIGANFEIEASTIRSGDPVFTPAPAAQITTGTIPTNSILTPAYSKMFVLDMPLLYDYHDLARVSSRYYVAVGSDTTTFNSADLYQSLDGLSFLNFDSVNVDCTWGSIVSGPLGAPAALHSTDDINTFTVVLSVDNGDLASVSLNDIVNGEANRALIVNQTTGDIEILQFQNVTANPDGSYTFDTLVRGRRGTDYAVDRHEDGEIFILVSDAAVVPQVNSLGAVGSTRYFKAVSRGGILSATPAVGELFEGRDLKPYAPNYVRRTDDTIDLTVLWNRRTRIGGVWNMAGTGIEEVPLNEDFEQYEVYLLPNTPTALEDFDPDDVSTYELVRQVATPEVVFTGTELATATYTLADDINVAVYQLSAQVGRGFGRIVALAP